MLVSAPLVGLGYRGIFWEGGRGRGVCHARGREEGCDEVGWEGIRCERMWWADWSVLMTMMMVTMMFVQSVDLHVLFPSPSDP